MTQRAIIQKYLQNLRAFGEGWIKEGAIVNKETPWGFIGFAGPRRVRELVEEDLLEHRMNGKYSEVRYKKPVQMSLIDKLKNYIQ